MVEKLLSPEEIRRRKNFKKGIHFIILICGQEGNGKSSFINSFCKQKVITRDTALVDPTESHLNPGLTISKLHVNIVEADSTPISLDLVLTPGFGDNIDNRFCIPKVVEYLEKQFDDFLDEECRIQRDTRFKDGRPHVALYFIRPTGKGLRELDVFSMKELASRVNVIPVIAKADSLTKEEIKLNKLLILQDIKANNIDVYDFTTELYDETDMETKSLREAIPFAISGSYDTEIINGTLYSVRRYPWGLFQVENDSQSDFTKMRNALLGSHLQELKDSTHSVKYEAYRRKKLEDSNIVDSPLEKNTRDTKPEGEKETLKEIWKKKKLIDDFNLEIKKLEESLRVCSVNISHTHP